MRGRSGLLAAVVAAMVGLWPAAAWAQDTIVVSNPVDYAALPSAPASIALTGSSAPDPDLSHVSLWDRSGRSLDDDVPLTARGRVLSRPVAIPATGDYTVTYHVVFTDGSDTVGVVHFSVGTGAPPPVPSAVHQAADRSKAEAHDHTGVDPVGGTLLVVDMLVLAGVVLLLISKPRLRPHRRTDGTSQEPSSPRAPPRK